ncbi:MAG: hypothetical protein R3C05_01820 [Pirellulaceae bacterium]
MSDGRCSPLRSDLKNSCRDGAAYSAMVATGESYLPAFALFIGVADVQAGLLASLPIFIGSVLQCNGFVQRRAHRSFRDFFRVAGGMQVAMLGFLALLALTGGYRHLEHSLSFAILMVIASLYWGGALACAAVWNTWIEYLVPRTLRHRFLARRTLLAQATLLSTLLAAGFLLRLGESWGRTGIVFGLLFTFASLSRAYSLLAVRRQTDKDDWHPAQSLTVVTAKNSAGSKLDSAAVGEAAAEGSRMQAFAPTCKSPYRLLVYLVAVQVSVYIAAPYFAAYMLRVLALGYVEFTVLIALGFAGKMMILPLAGRFAKRFGTTKLMIFGGVGMIPMGGLWVFGNSFAYLAAIQLASGIVWGCYELGNMLLILERIPTSARSKLLSRYHVFNAAAMVIGSMIGGLMLWRLGSSASAYLTVFAASSMMRLLTLPLLKAGLAGGSQMPKPTLIITQRQQSVRPSGLNIATPIVIDEELSACALSSAAEPSGLDDRVTIKSIPFVPSTVSECVGTTESTAV